MLAPEITRCYLLQGVTPSLVLLPYCYPERRFYNILQLPARGKTRKAEPCSPTSAPREKSATSPLLPLATLALSLAPDLASELRGPCAPHTPSSGKHGRRSQYRASTPARAVLALRLHGSFLAFPEGTVTPDPSVWSRCVERMAWKNGKSSASAPLLHTPKAKRNTLPRNAFSAPEQRPTNHTQFPTQSRPSIQFQQRSPFLPPLHAQHEEVHHVC